MSATSTAHERVRDVPGALERVPCAGRELTVSLRTLQIVLFRNWSSMRRSENLVFSADPVWMSGPFEWSPASLCVDAVLAADTPAAAFTSRLELVGVHDPIGFELLCEHLEVKENVGLL